MDDHPENVQQLLARIRKTVDKLHLDWPDPAQRYEAILHLLQARGAQERWMLAFGAFTSFFDQQPCTDPRVQMVGAYLDVAMQDFPELVATRRPRTMQ